MSGKPCPPNCKCRKHSRSDYHNYKISEGVLYAIEQKKKANGLSAH